jgi:hypothetical protein
MELTHWKVAPLKIRDAPTFGHLSPFFTALAVAGLNRMINVQTTTQHPPRFRCLLNQKTIVIFRWFLISMLTRPTRTLANAFYILL